MKLFSPNYEADEKDFSIAYENAVRFCLKNGYNIKTEYNQESLDMCSRITLSGRAIHQIKNRQLHKKFPTKGRHLQEYIGQFTPEFDASKFEYTYYSRLTNYLPNKFYGNLNQLKIIKNNLKTSRRLNAITWIPDIDLSSEHPPCLQSIQLRVLQEPDTDNHMLSKGRVEVFLNWRSRDLFSAFMSNLIGIVFMIYNEILDDKYEIVRLTDYTTMMHINENDWQAARLV